MAAEKKRGGWQWGRKEDGREEDTGKAWMKKKRRNICF
jgi:hypothetical protein